MGKLWRYPHFIGLALLAFCSPLPAADVIVDDSFFQDTDGQGREVYIDSRTSDNSGGSVGGLNATFPWANGNATLSWEISKGIAGDPADFHYVYTLDVKYKDISHAILEVSPNFTKRDFIPPRNGNGGGDDDGGGGDDDDGGGNGYKLEGPKLFSPGPGNPGLPGDIFGLKFDDVDSKELTIDFWSDRVPVWGDFYAKDGKNWFGDWVYLYNHDFGEDPMLVGFSQDVLANYLGFIPRPDTVVVPEPATLTLMGAGMGVAAAARRYRAARKKREKGGS